MCLLRTRWGVVGVVVFTPGDQDSVCESAVLADAAPDRKKNSDAKHNVKNVVVPYDGVKRLENFVQCFHVISGVGESGREYRGRSWPVS